MLMNLTLMQDRYTDRQDRGSIERSFTLVIEMQVDKAQADDAREQERLCALDRYDVLDTPPEEAFDRITRLVRRVFNVPISAISLIDGHRQWFKSRQGIDVLETDLTQSVCYLAVKQEQPLVVENALVDPRVCDNPSVTGGLRLRFYAGIPLLTPEGHAIGTLCAADTEPRSFSAADLDILSDLATLVMSELELRMLATADALTGAMSRRTFRDEAGRALSLAQRHDHDLSLLMLDLDHFKQVNDAHGHGTGDRLLRETVAVCRAGIRTSDMIGRLGGEEFAILLPHTKPSAALAVAEKLRSSIAGVRLSVGPGSISGTASFGVCGIDRSVHHIDTLLQRADAALFAAKADGRNRCCVWQPPVVETAPDQRRRVLKGGRIVFNAGRSTIDCTVRSLSQLGAAIDFVSTEGVPERFKLHILADDLHRSCQVAARSDKRLEVTFA
ncbi:hypothetical protein Sa4125_43030 [Aureimonas sp. SA4125]|nr:hypothetical protein Sa4125_43030 [Aureimonas sp. SA4125]